MKTKEKKPRRKLKLKINFWQNQDPEYWKKKYSDLAFWSTIPIAIIIITTANNGNYISAGILSGYLIWYTLIYLTHNKYKRVKKDEPERK